MKTAIFNPYWDTLGGGERYTASFISLMLSAGSEVDVVWPHDISPAVNSRFSVDISQARFIPKFNSSKYDLVFWVSDGSMPLSFARKTIIHFQFPFTKVGGRLPAQFLKSRFYTFVVNSDFTRQRIDKEFAVKSHVIYPPVDTNSFKPGKKSNVIVYVGRFSDLTQRKGHDVLIDAFRQASPRLPGWKLVLAGGTSVGTPPEMMESLSRLAAGLSVEILADPSFEKIQKVYSSAKIFWSASGFGADEKRNPTHVEHFGISLVEAMAAGCVPIVSNLGGHKEIVSQGREGFLWDTPAELVDTTVDLAQNPEFLKKLSHEAEVKSKIFDITRFNEHFSRLVGLIV